MENQQIVFLRGPDRVRKRPAVVFGSEGEEGVRRAVELILNLFVTEAQLGHAKSLTVIHSGQQVEISADDQGLYLGQDTADDRIWQNIFCDFALASAYPIEENGYRYGLTKSGRQELYGGDAEYALCLPEEVGAFDLCCVQYASAFMDVTVVRDGIQSELHFEKGYARGGMVCQATDAPSGTSIRFAMDPEIFTHIRWPEDWFRQTLRQYAMGVPGLTCRYRKGVDDCGDTYCYPAGLEGYLREKGAAQIYRNKLEARGRERYNRPDYQACVEVAVGYTPGQSEMLCLHNFRPLQGGKHWEALKDQVCYAFNLHFRREVGDQELTFEELSRHLTVVLATWCAPRRSLWGNGTRTSIENQVIADMTDDAFSHAFCDFVRDRADCFISMIDAIMQQRQE